MKNEYRVYVSVRVRGKAPMDSGEFKSEQYDDQEDFLKQIVDFIKVNIDDNEEGEEDDESDESN